MWSNLAFRAHRARLIVLGVDKAPDAQAEVSNRREIKFGVYLAPLDADPLVLDVDEAAEHASFIRFYCDWLGVARVGTEPDVYVRNLLAPR
jgi:hypothetical protein